MGSCVSNRRGVARGPGERLTMPWSRGCDGYRRRSRAVWDLGRRRYARFAAGRCHLTLAAPQSRRGPEESRRAKKSASFSIRLWCVPRSCCDPWCCWLSMLSIAKTEAASRCDVKQEAKPAAGAPGTSETPRAVMCHATFPLVPHDFSAYPQNQHPLAPANGTGMFGFPGRSASRAKSGAPSWGSARTRRVRSYQLFSPQALFRFGQP